VSPDDDPFWGPVAAPITIIEFSDYQCPFCKRFYDETIPQIQTTYAGQVRFVYRDFPLTSIHQYAQKASEASECADDQGRSGSITPCWANQQELDVPDLKAYAGQLGLDTATFNGCLDSGKNAQEVQKDYADGTSYGVTGTPTFFINDTALLGAQPFSAFQAIIDQLLAIAPTPSPTASPRERAAPRCPSATVGRPPSGTARRHAAGDASLPRRRRRERLLPGRRRPALAAILRWALALSTSPALSFVQAILVLGSGLHPPAAPGSRPAWPSRIRTACSPGGGRSTCDGPPATAAGMALVTRPPPRAAAYPLDPMTWRDGPLTSTTALRSAPHVA
jgi:predicted DsbA family dithiol-disulfide isomerase